MPRSYKRAIKPEFLRPSDVAKILGVCLATVHKMLRCGQIKGSFLTYEYLGDDAYHYTDRDAARARAVVATRKTWRIHIDDFEDFCVRWRAGMVMTRAKPRKRNAADSVPRETSTDDAEET